MATVGVDDHALEALAIHHLDDNRAIGVLGKQGLHAFLHHSKLLNHVRVSLVYDLLTWHLLALHLREFHHVGKPPLGEFEISYAVAHLSVPTSLYKQS